MVFSLLQTALVSRTAPSFAFDGFILYKTKQTEAAFKFLKWFIDAHYIRFIALRLMNFQPARLTFTIPKKKIIR